VTLIQLSRYNFIKFGTPDISGTSLINIQSVKSILIKDFISCKQKTPIIRLYTFDINICNLHLK
jgi:hypothetical protein